MHFLKRASLLLLVVVLVIAAGLYAAVLGIFGRDEGPGSISATPAPADSEHRACNFSRYCSSLDFWSINDHAEQLTPRRWQETIDSIRQCNAVNQDPENPDTVAFLGWEWSQMGNNPKNHFGHRNVILLGLEDKNIPARPIGASAPRHWL